jgi:hypothetical protein
MTEQAVRGEEIADAEVVAHPPQEMVVRQPAPALAVTPQVQATELVERLAVIRQAMTSAMQEGVDYGRIPGVDKPTLLKPGSEKLGVLFQLDIQLVNDKTWGPSEHLTVISHATVFHAPTGARLGYGEGLCTTREKKYAKRKQERECPSCGSAAVIKGKAEYGGGWLCWTKKGGCNAKWPDGAEVIEGQEAGEIDNPDLPDLWNTVIKMAEKRARVDAVLAVTGASALFTQDAEDLGSDVQAPASPPPAASPASGTRPTARAPQQTERPATAKQRGLINARSSAAGLTAPELGNALLAAAGQQTRAFDSDEHAKSFVDRQLDRLPGRLVDAVLQQISNAVDARAAA